MELTLQRLGHGENSSYGTLYIDNKHFCFTIEDEPRDIKVAGKTRIPSGRYQIDFNRNVTPLTKRYREKFDWFLYHLEIKNIFNFTNTYIHIGNKHEDSAGCPLVNRGVKQVNGDFVGMDSTSIYKELYKLLSDTLNKGEEVYINVRDEHYLYSPFL